ncbi:MAG TPA: sigma-70 family RNA polymerase sigma factor [Rhizomicrobium sp.]|jgi:RNA polymerase sigma-70 factor (ECF subfamily)|nr:sigma-70 family RNA polymerase sigma factor [Rhizomicrobium sp.]
MTKASDTERDCAGNARPSAPMSSPEALAWFLREVLPLESTLMQYLRHNWRDRSGVDDLLQDVYIRVFEAAQTQIPEKTKPFVFTTARNLLISRVREQQIVPIEAVADLDALDVAIDMPGPDRTAIARDELRRLQDAIQALPARYRDVVILRRIENLSRREIAVRLNLSEPTVSVYLSEGMTALADALYGQPRGKEAPR